MKNVKLSVTAFLSTCLLASTLTACGPQAFVPGTIKFRQTAGGMNLPSKVDILLGLDVKGTMQNIYPGMGPEFNTFAANLESSGWDYRIANVSLSEYEPGSTYAFNKIATSNYDSNWYTQVGPSSWNAPFPGAVGTNPALGVPSNYFTQIGPSQFFPTSITGNLNDGHKTGLLNQVNFLNRSDVQNAFLRPDALLAIITVSPSKDTSGGAWVSNPVNPQQVDWFATPDNFTQYQQSFLNLKTSSTLVKYYSIVSPTAQSNGACRGSNTFSGYRYAQMSTALGGQTYDICQTLLPAALNGVKQHLQTVRQNYRTVYVVLPSQPDANTLKVYKNGAALPIDPVNGWTYVDQVQTQYTIDLPINMNQATGYMIKLNGTARIQNQNDYIDVEFQNLGASAAF